MTDHYCKICHEWALRPAEHKCPPMFEVIRKGLEDDGPAKIYAPNPKEAAERWAAQHDSGSADYDIVAGRETPVLIVVDVAGGLYRYRVEGESVAVYTASLV